MMVKPDLESWHLDKRVPVGIIFALIMQTCGLVWWASKMDSRVASLEDADRKADQYHTINDAKLESLRADRDRLVRMETQLEAIQKAITRLETRMLESGGNGGR